MATQSQLEQPLEEETPEQSEDFIPEGMDPGTVLVFEKPKSYNSSNNSYVAALSCPRCGCTGLITHGQLYGGERMICASDTCSAEYQIDGGNFIYRQPQ